MKDLYPNYRGKPTAYLDHNVLDLLVKNDFSGFEEELKEKYQVVYSDENLKEIKRSGENGVKHLKILERVGAMYLKLVFTSEFLPTGDATVAKLNPFTVFSTYCENIDPVYEGIEKSTSQSLLKFYGGRSDAGFVDIDNEQINAFDDLMSYMRNMGVEISEAGGIFSNIDAQIVSYTEDMKRAYGVALAQASEQMRQYIDDEKNYSGVKIYREFTGIGPAQLNNIKPPNVIEKIWEAHKEIDGYREHAFSLEQFYGISLGSIYNREMLFFEKVTAIYNVLNVLGYHPDSKMKNERRFVAAMSDAAHASMGSFTDYVFSRDLAFVKKARACYEFLKLKSQVVEVKVNDR